MTSCWPVFIDGPLKGERHRVGERALRSGLLAWPASSLSIADLTHDPGVPFMPEPVLYTFHQVAMFGRILWVGSVHPVISPAMDDAAFEMLTSDAAKAAVTEPHAPHRQVGIPGSMAPAAEPSSRLSPDDALRLIDEAVADQEDFARPPRQSLARIAGPDRA
jgi:non-ribosomal peptide synthetase component F